MFRPLFSHSFEFFDQFPDKTHSILESEGFELDKDYYRVEPTLDCHQKESVQVSSLLHYMLIVPCVTFFFFLLHFDDTGVSCDDS